MMSIIFNKPNFLSSLVLSVFFVLISLFVFMPKEALGQCPGQCAYSGSCYGFPNYTYQPQYNNYCSNPTPYCCAPQPTNNPTPTPTPTPPSPTPPTATLKKSINGSPYNIGDAAINNGDQVSLEWESTYATDGCIGTGSGFYTLGAESGEDTTITEPDPGYSTTYTVECTGPGGTASSSLTITTNAVAISPPTVTLEASTDNGNTYTDQDIDISSSDTVQLKWRSTSTVSCSGSGGDFSTGGSTSGTDDTITEPTTGNSVTYYISCTGTDGSSALDNLTIATLTSYSQSSYSYFQSSYYSQSNYSYSQSSYSGNPTPSTPSTPPTATLQKNIFSNGNWSGWSEGDATINVGDQVRLQWSSTSTASCSGTGSGFDTGDSVSGIDDDIYEPAVGGSEIYTVTCIIN